MAYELRAKRPDLNILSNIHERAIAEAAKRRASGEAGAEEALRLWWASYVDSMVCYVGACCSNIDIYLFLVA